jgi:Acetoacetate decarboxylase (ADC)
MSRYEMPTVFGPSLIPDHSTWGGVEMVSVSFATSRAAATALVPDGVDVVGEEPVVTVSRMTYTNVDYLAGGGYNEVTVGVAASVADEGGPVRGSFMPVVWVDEPIPIQIGREFLGYAKVPGELPPAVSNPDGYEFELRERDTLLLRGRASELQPLTGERLDRLQHGAAKMTALGWKYIPSMSGPADADYPTRIPLSFEWDSVSTGSGSLEFTSPAWAAAPVSARIVAALGALPVLAPPRATVATGRGSIDRTAARRLSPPQRTHA